MSYRRLQALRVPGAGCDRLRSTAAACPSTATARAPAGAPSAGPAPRASLGATADRLRWSASESLATVFIVALREWAWPRWMLFDGQGGNLPCPRSASREAGQEVHKPYRQGADASDCPGMD
jgi:hypothetical protein